MRNIKGSVLLDTLVAVFCSMIVISIVSSLVLFVKNIPYDDSEDYLNMVQLWEDKARCRIYCPKRDVILDITF